MIGFNDPVARPPMSGPNLGGLLNTANNFQFPITSGLMGAMAGTGTAPPGVQNYSDEALQMAGGGGGNPGGSGMFPSVPVPAATPGSIPSTGGGSNFASTAGGLLAALAKNPSLVKGGVNAGKGLMNLLGGGGSAAAAGALPALSSADIAAGAYGGLSDAAATAAASDIAANATLDPAVTAAVDAAYGAAAPAAAGAGAGAAGTAAAMSPLAGAGLGLGAAAGLYGLYALDQKQSQLSPLSMAEMAQASSNNMANAAKQIRAGSTGPNGVYQGYGVSQDQVAQNQQQMSGLMQYLANSYMHMSAAQLNNDNQPVVDLLGAPLGSPGGLQGPNANRYLRPT